MVVSRYLHFAFALTGMLGVAGAASAETQWERDHPRRDQVNDRLANQNARIDTERNKGEISGARAAALHQQVHTTRMEERGMAAQNGGHISATEQKALNQQENQTSRQIGK